MPNGWELSRRDHEEEALRLLREQRPKMLVGSPPCTPHSAWQYINEKKRDPDLVRLEKGRGNAHFKFVAAMYREQAAGGRYFLHEHSAGATSWGEESIREIMNISDVDAVVMDQCQLGADDGKGKPLRKSTRWMWNSREVLRELDRRCTGRLGACSRPVGGRHALCSGLVARRAATYPFRLCWAILAGFRTQLIVDGVIKKGSVGMHFVGDGDLEGAEAAK